MVAFESTLITHGLPTPDNLEVALGAEDDVRAGGAVPGDDRGAVRRATGGAD